MTIYHVAQHVPTHGCGSEAAPFATVGQAAAAAKAGDEIVVHEGVYREAVAPVRGGENATNRIVYRAADGEHVAIKGSEAVADWTRDETNPDVYKAVLPNAMFGDFNPFARPIFGDWVVDASSHAATLRRSDDPADKALLATFPAKPTAHLGCVWLEGKALYEAFSLAEVRDPKPRKAARDHGAGVDSPLADPESSTRVWYAEVEGDALTGTTTIWANFGGADPTDTAHALVEVSVRETVFRPIAPQINYLTVRGFELAQAATPWAPPTADQIGLIDTHWSRGWVIEDCDIHDAKCSGVALGKEASTGDNDSTVTHRKSGYQYQMEAVFKALRFGWAKGVVGGHVVRDNHIHDCGQTGVVGHMGCAFSVIEHNHIHDIATRREFWGHEIGGIKLHAPIDTTIRANNIHDCTLGTWLDWQTQGTHIDANVYWNNTRDLMVEVSHGPYTVSNNVFASPTTVEVSSDGGAYVNNLFAGRLRLAQVMDRSTPYHFAHTTEVAGSAFVYGGDDRYLNNVFVKPAGSPADPDEQDGWFACGHGLRAYSHQTLKSRPRGRGEAGERPADLAGYEALATALVDGDEEAFREVPQPVLARDNTYLGGARGLTGNETGAVVGDGSASISVAMDEAAGTVSVRLDVSAVSGASDSSGSSGSLNVSAVSALAEVVAAVGAVVRTSDLGEPRIVEARYEQADGNPFVFDTDITGVPRDEQSSRGPLAHLTAGESRIVWTR